MNDTISLVGKEISGCEILSKTAEGGMGAVYKARHKALNRIVCVKILSPSLANDKKAVELFLTEARAIAELDHPNIVNVYNVGKEKGFYFIVMSFIEGQTLSMLLKKNKVLPIGQVLDLFDGVLQGLDAAHAKGIIHRDIKPSNILITPEGQAKVVDFGIAKKVDKDKGSTKTTELAGTAYFIAPEQALGRDLDTRADLYSIGASMYYVLTGQFPYNGKNTIDIIQKHINEPIPDPSKIRKDMPGWVSLGIQKLMSKEPNDRFRTAKETYTYFRKMRAEEQLRLKSGNAGRTIELRDEGPLKIIKEEQFSTDTVKKQRLENSFPTHRVTSPSSSNLPSLPGLDDIPEQKPTVRAPFPAVPTSTEPTFRAPQNTVMPQATTTATTVASGGLKKDFFRSNVARTILRLLGFLPLFLAMAGGIIYLFYSLGKICSVHISANMGLFHSIIAPFRAAEYAPNQLAFTAIAIIAIALILASSAIKAFSHSTTNLLILAFSSYLAGLYTPEVPFMELSMVKQFLFTPEYCLCYLAIAAVWAVSLCWTVNRTLPKGILGVSLVLLSMAMAYMASHLSIAPDAQETLTKMFLYASIFCTLLVVYYFLAPKERNAMFLPTFLFLLGIVCLWSYSVSGLAKNMNGTIKALTAKVEVKHAHADKQNMNINAGINAFSQINNLNELSSMTEEEGMKFLEPQVEKAAPDIFDEENKQLFLRLLTTYYKEGSSRMKLDIWDYSFNYPVQNFNNNAKNNNAYFFLILMLSVLGVLGCAGTIIFGDDL